MTDGAALDSLLEKMMQLILDNHRIEWLYEEMQFLRNFLKDSEEKRNEYEELKAIVANIRDLTHRVEDVIDGFLLQFIDQEQIIALISYLYFLLAFLCLLFQFPFLGDMVLGLLISLSFCLITCGLIQYSIKVLVRKCFDLLVLKYLSDDMKDIKLIKTQVMEIYEKKKLYGIRNVGVRQIGKLSHGDSSRPICKTIHEETIVGFDDEASTVMELLTQQHGKQLKVVSILGMPGLGKTTLARKVYHHPIIQYYFHIHAWTNVSPVYQKRDLLLAIFCSAFQFRPEFCHMSDEKLGEDLYKHLKGRRYLIVLDDIWTEEAWVDLKRYFPNDRNGSTILCTSRHECVAVALHAKFHYLRFLDENESWNLLRMKTFGENSCPPGLMETGKKIAKKCQGLPLAIVVISGLLAKNDKTLEWWRHVAQSVSSYIVSDSEKYMDTLALSYNHLPQHLKPCFLYFGAFPGDYEIPVWQLIWLWVAEGFVRQNDQKSLEEVAEDYLMNLIDRSLVVVSKKRSNGRIKACRIHDLLRDLCLRKAQEEKFLQHISRFSYSSSSNPIAYKQRRLCIHDNLVDYTSFEHYNSHIQSFLSFGRSFYCLPFYELPKKNVSFVCQAFKLLRVLNLFSIKILLVPYGLKRLVHLRYLALHVEQERLEPSISDLQNLETIIIGGPKGSFHLYDIWKLVNLRHVYSSRPIQIHGATPKLFPRVLDNLQTIGKLHGGHDLAWLPNLKKLKCLHDGFPIGLSSSPWYTKLN